MLRTRYIGVLDGSDGAPQNARMKHYTSIEALESRIAPAGIVTVIYDPVSHELTLTGDDASNAVSIFQTGPTSWRVEGQDDAALVKTELNETGTERLDMGGISKLIVDMRGGNDIVEVVSLRGLKSLNVDLGSGSDRFESWGLAVKGDATFTTGSGLDSVKLDGMAASISGNLSITDAAEGLVFSFDAATTSVGGRVSFTGSAASDTLQTATDTILKIGKNVEFTSNGGFDSLSFGSQGTTSIGRDALGRSVVYNGGSGTDRLAIGSHRVTLLGSVEMTGAGGNDTLDLDGVTVSVGRSLAGVSVFLDGGLGPDQIDLAGTSFTAAGLVRLDGGADIDKLDATGIHRLALRGGIRMDGGIGADLLDVETESLSVIGAITFDGGDDADVAKIEGDGTIKGAVSLNLGGAGAGVQNADLRSRSGLPGALKITGAVTVGSTGAAASSDIAKLTNVSIAGALAMSLGDGISLVDIDNISTGGIVTIDTRGGNDEVEIERDATFGTSTFKQRAQINLGAGEDTLLIGKSSRNNRVIFMSTLQADGGEGTDSRNDIVGDNSGLPASGYDEIAFETVAI